MAATGRNWERVPFRGETIVFALDQWPSARAYLDDLMVTIRGTNALCMGASALPSSVVQHTVAREVAERVYNLQPVQVNLLGDAGADGVLPDLWSSFHLATLLDDSTAMGMLLHFHATFGGRLLQDLVAERGEGDDGKAVRREGGEAGEDVSSPVVVAHPPPESRQLLLYREDISSLAHLTMKTVATGDCAASLRCGEEALATGDVLDPAITPAGVAEALKPILALVVAAHRAADAPPTTTTPSPVAEAVQQFCAESKAGGTGMHSPALAVEAGLLYDLCDGDLDALDHVTRTFAGTLTPVFRCWTMVPPGHESGRSTPHERSTSRSPTSTPKRSPQRHSTGGGLELHCDPSSESMRGLTPLRHAHIDAARGTFWFTHLAPQEHQRVAFYARWINARVRKAAPPTHLMGAATQMKSNMRVQAHFLQKIRGQLARQHEALPSSLMWSGHLQISSRMLSHTCTLEDFSDIIEEGAFLTATHAGGMPGGLAATLAACTLAASRLRRWRSLTAVEWDHMDLLQAKVAVAVRFKCGFSNDASLATFAASVPATHTERFSELWIAQTPQSAPRKFKSRAELVCFVAVESILDVVEDTTPAESMQPEEVEDIGREEAQRREMRSTRSRSASMSQHSRSPSTASSSTAVRSSSSGLPAPGPAATPSVRRLLTLIRRWIHLWSLFFSDVKERCEERTLVKSLSSRTATAVVGAAMAAITAGDDEEDDDDDDESGDEEDGGAAELAEAMAEMVSGLPRRLKQSPSCVVRGVHRMLYPGDTGEVTIEERFALAQTGFAKAAAAAPDETKLRFYGLYKQATVGDVNVPRPWVMDPRGRAKWDAWSAQKGLTTAAAMGLYVAEWEKVKSSVAR